VTAPGTPAPQSYDAPGSTATSTPSGRPHERAGAGDDPGDGDAAGHQRADPVADLGPGRVEAVRSHDHAHPQPTPGRTDGGRGDGAVGEHAEDGSDVARVPGQQGDGLAGQGGEGPDDAVTHGRPERVGGAGDERHGEQPGRHGRGRDLGVGVAEEDRARGLEQPAGVQSGCGQHRHPGQQAAGDAVAQPGVEPHGLARRAAGVHP
jgi:hypothetical protein